MTNRRQSEDGLVPITLEPSTLASRRAAREAAGRPERQSRSPLSVSALYGEPVTVPGRVPVKDRTATDNVIVVQRGGNR